MTTNTDTILLQRHQHAVRQGLYDILERNEKKERKGSVALEGTRTDHTDGDDHSSHSIAIDHSHHNDCSSPSRWEVVCNRNDNTFYPMPVSPGQSPSAYPMGTPLSFRPISSTQLDTNITGDSFTHSPRRHGSMNTVSPLIISAMSTVVEPLFHRSFPRHSPPHDHEIFGTHSNTRTVNDILLENIDEMMDYPTYVRSPPRRSPPIYDHDITSEMFVPSRPRTPYKGQPYHAQLENIGHMMVSEGMKQDSPILSRCNSLASINNNGGINVNTLSPELSLLPSYRSPRIHRTRSPRTDLDLETLSPLCIETVPGFSSVETVSSFCNDFMEMNVDDDGNDEFMVGGISLI